MKCPSISLAPLLVLLMGLMTPLSGVYAQSYPPSAETKAETATDKAPVEAVAQTKSLKSFERDARLETMRYRHLWLAYAFIWLIIFGFVFRTWKMSSVTKDELESLKSRLNRLER